MALAHGRAPYVWDESRLFRKKVPKPQDAPTGLGRKQAFQEKKFQNSRQAPYGLGRMQAFQGKKFQNRVKTPRVHLANRSAELLQTSGQSLLSHLRLCFLGIFFLEKLIFSPNLRCLTDVGTKSSGQLQNDCAFSASFKYNSLVKQKLRMPKKYCIFSIRIII